MTQVNGVVVATVLDVHDPDGLGRVKIQFPWMGGHNESHWARVATLMAGNNHGSWFMPEVGSEVLTAFDHGHVNHPCIVGYCWNGGERPPETDPNLRLFRSVRGHEIVIYDPPEIVGGDQGYIQIKDAIGNLIELSNDHVAITSVGAVYIDAPNVFINGRPVAPAPKPI